MGRPAYLEQVGDILASLALGDQLPGVFDPARVRSIISPAFEFGQGAEDVKHEPPALASWS